MTEVNGTEEGRRQVYIVEDNNLGSSRQGRFVGYDKDWAEAAAKGQGFVNPVAIDILGQTEQACGIYVEPTLEVQPEPIVPRGERGFGAGMFGGFMGSGLGAL